MKKKTAVSIGIFGFIIYIAATVIMPVHEWISLNLWHRPLYTLFGDNLSLRYWLFEINHYIMPWVLVFGIFAASMLLYLFSGKSAKRGLKSLFSFTLVLALVLVIAIPLMYFSSIKDFEAAAHNDYITEKISLEYLQKSVAGDSPEKTDWTTIHYLVKNEDYEKFTVETFYLDIVSYNKLLAFRENLREKFIRQYSLEDKCLAMPYDEFLKYLDSLSNSQLLPSGANWRDYLQENKVEILYLPVSKFIAADNL